MCGVLVAALMIPLASAAPGSGNKSLSDVQGHWAQQEIETAIASGWVDGYPDGTFKPEKAITRAEFTKMLLDAIHLTPGSETVVWMKGNARTGGVFTVINEEYTPRLNDMDSHWLTTQAIRLQVVDQVVYASLNDLDAQLRQMMRDSGDPDADNGILATLEWFPVEQRYANWVYGAIEPYCYLYWMGDSKYYWYSGSQQFLAPARTLYGELMVPVCDLNHPSSEPQETGWQAGWDSETNTLTILMHYRKPWFQGS